MKTHTLPSGMKLQGETMTDLMEAIYQHSVAALSEHMCPLCCQSLIDARVPDCLRPGHRPVRFHLCPDRQRVTEFYLDVPFPRQLGPCDRCGQAV